MRLWAHLACASLVALSSAVACASTSTRPEPAPEKKVRVAKKRTPGDETPTAVAREKTPPLALVQPPPPTVAVPPETGLASFYADSLAGNKTASGERYRPQERTCAHRTHKFGTALVVTAIDTGKSAVCRVNDRGPFVAGRVVDVSRRIADELGMKSAGVIRVRIEVAPDGSGS